MNMNIHEVDYNSFNELRSNLEVVTSLKSGTAHVLVVRKILEVIKENLKTARTDVYQKSGGENPLLILDRVHELELQAYQMRTIISHSQALSALNDKKNSEAILLLLQNSPEFVEDYNFHLEISDEDDSVVW